MWLWDYKTKQMSVFQFMTSIIGNNVLQFGKFQQNNCAWSAFCECLTSFKGFKEPNSSVQGQEESENQMFRLIKVLITLCKFVHCGTTFNADMLYFNVYCVCFFIIILHRRCKLVAAITTIGVREL